jgi:hypothetical protein
MSDELALGLAASANEPTTETATPDTVLDAAFAEPSVEVTPSESTTGEQPVAATQLPPDPATTTDAVKGEPPKERWDSILANARTKAREEALAEHKNALEIFKSLQSDLPGTLTQMLEEAAGDQRFSDQITAKAAAILNARKAQAKADSEPQPDAVMRYEDGTQEPTYTPAQQRKWAEWNSRQMKSGLLNDLKPLLEMKEQIDAHRETQRVTQEAVSVAEKRGATWKSMPFFEDHKGAILERQKALFADASQQPGFDAVNGPWELLQQAYAEVVQTQALPKLQSQQTDSLVAQAARKRAGSSSDPAASAPAQPRKPRTVDEALDQVYSNVSA